MRKRWMEKEIKAGQEMAGTQTHNAYVHTCILHILVDGWKHICIHFFKYTCRAHRDCIQNAQFQKPDIIRSGGKIGMHEKEERHVYILHIVYKKYTRY